MKKGEGSIEKFPVTVQEFNSFMRKAKKLRKEHPRSNFVLDAETLKLVYKSADKLKFHLQLEQIFFKEPKRCFVYCLTDVPLYMVRQNSRNHCFHQDLI